MLIPKKYEFNGEQLTMAQIAERSGHPARLLRRRMARGLTIEEAASKTKVSSSAAGRIGKKRSPWIKPWKG